MVTLLNKLVLMTPGPQRGKPTDFFLLFRIWTLGFCVEKYFFNYLELLKILYKDFV